MSKQIDKDKSLDYCIKKTLEKFQDQKKELKPEIKLIDSYAVDFINNVCGTKEDVEYYTDWYNKK